MERKLTKKEKKLYDEARPLIEEWREIEKAQRYYEGKRWHCVNVKRYHDDIDHKDLSKIAIKVAPRAGDIVHTALVEYVYTATAIEDDQGYGMYCGWISYLWDQMNEHVEECAQDDYSHIATGPRSDNRILSLGRSGGWACFTTDGENIADDLEELTDSIEELDVSMHMEIVENIKELRETIAQVHNLKTYIQKFNDGADFANEVKFRMEEKSVELENIGKRLTVYDTGENSTVDRYTVIFDGVAYGMSVNPLSPNGFNQYIGNRNKLNITALGKVVPWYSLPEEVKRAIGRRITN